MGIDKPINRQVQLKRERRLEKIMEKNTADLKAMYERYKTYKKSVQQHPEVAKYSRKVVANVRCLLANAEKKREWFKHYLDTGHFEKPVEWVSGVLSRQTVLESDSESSKEEPCSE